MTKNWNLDHINPKQDFTPEEETLIFAGTAKAGLVTKEYFDEALGYIQHMNKPAGLFIPDITRPPGMSNQEPEFENYSKEPIIEYTLPKLSYLERILLHWLGTPFLKPYQIDINARIYYYQEFV